MEEIRIEDITSSFGKVSINFTGIASDLYKTLANNNEFERLKKIEHLGLIAKSFKTLSHTRYDYFMVQSVMTEIVENTFRGTTMAQGSIKIGGKSYRGNEVLKVWIMLSNIGHCKYTIGDEKAMMIYASKRKGFKSMLFKKIVDKSLIEWADKVIDRFDYVRFHHVLSIYRVRQFYKRRTNKQEELLDIYKALLLPSNKVDSVVNKVKLIQLKTLYKNIRDLSIISLDTVNSHLPIRIDILSTILSFDFNSDKFQGRHLSQLFHPLTNLLYDNIYLATQVQTLQRSYEIRAIQQMQNFSYLKIIHTSFEEGLADSNKCHLLHFVRKEYTLAPTQKLKDHFNISQQVKKDSTKYETSIDFNLLTKKAVVDFYIVEDEFEVKDLPLLLHNTFNISNIIDKKQLLQEVEDINKPITERLLGGLKKEGVPNESIKRIMDPIVNYLADDFVKKNYRLNLNFFQSLTWSVIRYFIKSKYYFDLDTSIEGESFAARYPDGTDFIKKRIDSEKKKYTKTDLDRVKELEHLESSIKQRYSGYTIVCIDRIKIYDYSQSPDNRTVTDIDSLVLKFNSREVILEFNETKNVNNPVNVAKKDLKEKFVKVLSETAKGYRVQNVDNFGARVRIKIRT